MQSVVDAVRQLLGTPTFQDAAMYEYLVSALLLLIVVSSVFKIVIRVFK